jgi:hypothetical protein
MEHCQNKLNFDNKQGLINEITSYKNAIRKISDKISLLKFLCEGNFETTENLFNIQTMNIERLKKEKNELEKNLKELEESITLNNFR